jgi:hypothetical protein
MLWELTTLRPLNGLAETSIVVGVLSGLPLIASGQSSIGFNSHTFVQFAAATMKFRATSVLMRPVTRMRTPGTAARDRLPLIGSETAHTPVGCAGKPLLAQQSVGCRDDSAQCRLAQGGPWFAVQYPEARSSNSVWSRCCDPLTLNLTRHASECHTRPPVWVFDGRRSFWWKSAAKRADQKS